MTLIDLPPVASPRYNPIVDVDTEPQRFKIMKKYCSDPQTIILLLLDYDHFGRVALENVRRLDP